MKAVVSFVVGLIFAFGLTVSDMVNPTVVKGFLRVFDNWNPSLMGVMVGAIGVHAIAYFFIMMRRKPVLDTAFHVPQNKKIDVKLIGGAVLFGLGWGMTGICPGPGIVALTSGHHEIYIFVAAMLSGMLGYVWLGRDRT